MTLLGTVTAAVLGWAAQEGREMSTDRPDKTESPTTVDAGRVQIEMDLAVGSSDFSTAGDDRTITSSRSVASFNLRVGVSDEIELDLQLDPYVSLRLHDRETGEVAHQHGFGDTTLRAKWCLAGNDGGSPGFAVLPFLTLPTHHGKPKAHDLGGGMILPVSLNLPLEFSLGAMTEVEAVHVVSQKPYDAVFINSISASHAIAGGLVGYGEFYSEVVARRGNHWIGTADGGLMFKVAENVQLDAGVNFGITRIAPDREYFAGISWRL
jgi:hypothetical protein